MPKKLRIILLAAVATLLAACAPVGYQYRGLTLEPIPGYQKAQQGHEWGEYVDGRLDCRNQNLMPESDCQFGQFTKAYPNENQIRVMNSYGVSTPAQYETAIAEANSHKGFETAGKTPVEIWNIVDGYLATKQRAIKAGQTVEQIVYKDAQEKQRKRAEFNAKYPYLAELTCTMGSGQAVLMTCFSPLFSQDGGTVLELKNGDEYHMYQFMDVAKAGIYLDGVFVIPLHKSFTLKAQNNSNNFLLNLVVKDSTTGQVVYRKSAQQFGYVYVNNQ